MTSAIVLVAAERTAMPTLGNELALIDGVSEAYSVGGEWDFVMHGPDGTDYQDWILYTEIIAPERIAMLHGEFPGDPNAFSSLITFAAQGETTVVEMRTLFPSKASRDEAVEKFHAVEGGQQTLANLDAYLVEGARNGEEN